jgi:prepilin-type N-terminal cleavage/methylation domain-containing protein
MTSVRSSEAGFTLIELLIAMIVLSVGVIAVLGALRLGVDSGRLQRELSAEELTLRSFAEYVKAEPYVDCAGLTTYGAGFDETDLLGGALLPQVRVLRPEDPESPEVVFTAVVDGIDYLTSGAMDDGVLAFTVGGSDFGTSCSDDQGLQLIRVQIRTASAASGQDTETVLETTILKRAG